MAPALPDDIIFMVCSQLLLQKDFDTLFQCIVSSRKLAIPAATHLYR